MLNGLAYSSNQESQRPAQKLFGTLSQSCLAAQSLSESSIKLIFSNLYKHSKIF
jgi:hypothetical protein